MDAVVLFFVLGVAAGLARSDLKLPPALYDSLSVYLLLAIGNQRVCTLNALSSALHAGTAPIHYGRPGHILGSVNLPYSALLDAQGRFLPAEQLRAALHSVGALEAPRVICYCGGGIAATLDAMALHIAGHTNVAVYDGSLQEWAADPTLPMATAG